MMKCAACGELLERNSMIPYYNYEFPEVAEFRRIEGTIICQHCGLGVAFPTAGITAGFLENFYNSHFWRSPEYSKPSDIIFKHSIAIQPLALVMLINVFLDNKRSERIEFLEIGPGAFGLSPALRWLFPNCQVYAYELDEQNIKSLQNLGVICYQELFSPSSSQPDRNFDAIIMSHVLEHFSPEMLKPTFMKIKELLKPGGLIIIEIPNCCHSICGKHEGHNDCPHLLFFTPKSVKKFFENLDMEVLFLGTSGITHDERWQNNKNSAQPHGSTLKKYLKFILPRKMGDWWTRARFYRMINKLGTFPDFTYGADRVYIRAIIRKSRA